MIGLRYIGSHFFGFSDLPFIMFIRIGQWIWLDEVGCTTGKMLKHSLAIKTMQQFYKTFKHIKINVHLRCLLCEVF